MPKRRAYFSNSNLQILTNDTTSKYSLYNEFKMQLLFRFSGFPSMSSPYYVSAMSGRWPKVLCILMLYVHYLRFLQFFWQPEANENVTSNCFL